MTEYVFIDMHGYKLILPGAMTVEQLLAKGYAGFTFKKPDTPLEVGEWRCEHKEENTVSSAPILKRGDIAEFKCESCGTHPKWGRARRGWWLACECWTGGDFTDRADVLADWKKDTKKRIKANAKKP